MTKDKLIAPFGLRLQPDLKSEIQQAATRNKRSMNAEIVSRLSAPEKTLLDEFAMAALTGYYAAPDTGHQNADSMETAYYCYSMAVKMLTAREELYKARGEA